MQVMYIFGRIRIMPHWKILRLLWAWLFLPPWVLVFGTVVCLPCLLESKIIPLPTVGEEGPILDLSTSPWQPGSSSVRAEPSPCPGQEDSFGRGGGSHLGECEGDHGGEEGACWNGGDPHTWLWEDAKKTAQPAPPKLPLAPPYFLSWLWSLQPWPRHFSLDGLGWAGLGLGLGWVHCCCWTEPQQEVRSGSGREGRGQAQGGRQTEGGSRGWGQTGRQAGKEDPWSCYCFPHWSNGEDEFKMTPH